LTPLPSYRLVQNAMLGNSGGDAEQGGDVTVGDKAETSGDRSMISTKVNMGADISENTNADC
jgi:hypothetical protein